MAEHAWRRALLEGALGSTFGKCICVCLCVYTHAHICVYLWYTYRSVQNSRIFKTPVESLDMKLKKSDSRLF